MPRGIKPVSFLAQLLMLCAKTQLTPHLTLLALHQCALDRDLELFTVSNQPVLNTAQVLTKLTIFRLAMRPRSEKKG